MSKNNIILIGMPGSGKSTLGVVLAKKIGYSFIDSDIVIQDTYKKTLEQLIEENGDTGFIKIENDVNCLISPEHTIIATGGSAVYGDEAMEHFKQIGTVIYLKVSEKELESRLGSLKERGVVSNGKSTVEEIFEKKLYFLIPFHIFVYEKSFKELEENSEKLAKLEEEYTAIVNRLEEDRKNGDLNEYEKVTILEMSDTVIKHLAEKYEKVRKGVGESMGGKVLEYEAKDILNRGRAEGYLEGEACGRREGRDEGRAEGEITGMKKAKMQLAVKLLQAGNSVAYVADLTELPEETVQKLSQAVEREDE